MSFIEAERPSVVDRDFEDHRIATRLPQLLFDGRQQHGAGTCMLRLGEHVNGDDAPHSSGGAALAEAIGNHESLDASGTLGYQCYRSGHSQEVTQLIFGVGNTLDKTSPVDLQKTLEVFRPVLAQTWHERSGSSRGGLFAAVLTNAVDLKIVASSVKMVFAPDLLLKLADFRRKELDRGAALGAHHVMVAAAVELVLVARHAVGKRNGAGQAAFRQKLERAINGGEADLRVFLSDQAKQLVRGQMVAGLKKRAQNGVTLFCMLQTDAFQVLKENFLGLAHGFARGRGVIVDPSLQHKSESLGKTRQMKMKFIFNYTRCIAISQQDRLKRYGPKGLRLIAADDHHGLGVHGVSRCASPKQADEDCSQLQIQD